MRCRPRSGRYHNYIKDNAAAAATTLTIRHSRFAALPLAKLVASLALHPPVSATGSGGFRASSGSLHSPPSPPRGRLLVTVLSYTRFPLRLIPTPNHRPRGTLIADQRGRAQHDQGGKQEANGGKLAFIRAVQAFTCHGGRVARATPSFIQLTFTSHAAFFGTFLGSKKVPFSSFPSFPYRRFLRLYLAICFIFSCLAASCAARSDSAVSA